MALFTPATDLFILLGIFAHYSLGRRLGFQDLIAGALVGVCVEALAVATLANVCAGLIHPFVIASTSFFGAVTLWDFLRTPPIDRENGGVYALLLAVGVVFAIVLNPSQRNVFTDAAGREILRYNNHYPYFASQVIEMLRADYFSRLRFMDLYPLEWGRYHFFNTATIAVVQAFVAGSNLFSYFAAKAWLTILILLAILECQWLHLGFTVKSVLASLFALLFGWILFFDIVSWNFSTSGSFSIYGAMLMVLSLYLRQPSRAAAYALILTASAIRFVPIGGIAVLGILWFFLDVSRPGDLFPLAARMSRWQVAALALFVLYHVATIFGASGSGEAMISKGVFSDGWMYGVFVYKVAGIASKALFSQNNFRLFDITAFFSPIIASRGLTILFLGYLTFLSGLLAFFSAGVMKRDRAWPELVRSPVFWSLLVFAALSRTSPDMARIHKVLLSTMVLTSAFLLLAVDNVKERGALIKFVFLIQAATLVFQYTGNDGLKAPVAYVLFDVVLWAAISVFFLSAVQSRASTFLAVCVAAVIFFIPVYLTRTLDLTFSSFNVNALIDVSPLMKRDFIRSSAVDDRNMLTIASSDVSFMEAYSSVLGARVPYSNLGHGFMNYRFLKKSDLGSDKF